MREPTYEDSAVGGASGMHKDRLRLGAVLIFGCALAAFHVLRLPRVLIDDAFISYRYAQNLVNGYGLTFNPSERVEGYSNFLWVVLTAVGMLIENAPTAWTRAYGAIACLGSLVAGAYLAKKVTGRNWAAWLTACGIGASTAFISSAMGGLETGMFAFLITSAMVALAHERLWLASGIMGLAAWTRPEGAALCAVGLIAILLVDGLRAGNRSRCFRDGARMLFPCLGATAAMFVFRLSYFGQWMPNSVRAKSTMLPRLRESDIGEWPRLLMNAEGIGYVSDFLQYAFGALACLSLVPILWSGSRRLALMMFGTVAMGLTVSIYNFGDWMSSFRLLTPYLPTLTVLVAWGIHETLEWLRIRGHAKLVAPCGAMLGGWMLFCVAGQFQWRLPTVASNPDRELGYVLNASRQPGLLAATDVLGRLGYYADHVRILDMAGLTDLHIAEHGAPSPPFGKTDFDYVLSCEPHFIMNNVRSAWRDKLDRAAFVQHYWWVDEPAWTLETSRFRPRFVFIRRGSLLESEIRARYHEARFRSPAEVVDG